MVSKIYKGTTKDHSVRFFIADTKELVEKARLIHDTLPVSTAAFGRTLTGAAIMGKMLKNETDSITFQINGSAYIKSIMAVSDCHGNVKGYISTPQLDIPLRADGKLDVGGAIGDQGSMIVIKDYGMKQPFIGKTKLVSGEVAEDLAHYFMNSEQQPSIVSLGVFIDTDLSVSSAGGIIIQPLPDADEAVIIQLEEALKSMPTMTELFKDKMTPLQMAQKVLPGFEVIIDEENEIDFVCDCSKEKFERGIISLGPVEIQDLIEEMGRADVQCHFCNKEYHFSLEELESCMNNM